MISLPKQKIKASSQSPNNLIIFSKPKVGKTSALAQLENALILDLERGSDFVDALKVSAESVDDIREIGEAILKENKPYDYIIVDTITRLEEIAADYAESLYSKKPMGKTWFKTNSAGELSKDSGKAQYGTILNLPQGAGYAHLREAMTKLVEYIKSWAPRLILVAHIKDIYLEKKGSSFEVSDLDLTGKIKRIMTSQSDAIGYLYRKGNENILSFNTSDKVACGARPRHLQNREIVLSSLSGDGTLSTYWDKIYID